MSISYLEHLRQLIEQTLLELGMSDALWTCIKTTFQERQINETPAPEGILVVWLTDRNALEFHAENGVLLKTVRLDRKDLNDLAA
jgi:hypothetical protein